MRICQVLWIRPKRLYIVKYKGSRSVSDLWIITLNIIKVNNIDVAVTAEVAVSCVKTIY